MIRHMSLPKIMMILFVICAFLSGYAQDDIDAQETTYRYYVPFPESNFRGDWQFTLVAGPDLAKDYNLTVSSYNFFGEPIETRTQMISGGLPYFWQDGVAGAKVQFELQVQTMVLESSEPLSGVLWVFDPTADVLNAVSITDVARGELILPHVPSDFYTWNTSFSIMGIGSDTARSADIEFDYFSNTRSGNTTAWSGLESNAYHNGTPFRDILITDVDAVTWGKVRVQNPENGFRLAGYQSYLKATEGVQSAAIELVDQPLDNGYFGFSRHENWNFSEWFAFTNPHDMPARIEMTLFYVSGEGDTDVHTATETITLPARNRYNYILGLNLFSGFEGQAIGLEYNAFKPLVQDQSAEELPVLITHLQSDVDATALGAHAPQNRGNRSVAFLSPRFDQRIDLYNPSMEAADSVDVTVYFANDMAPFTKAVAVPAGHNVTITHAQLLEDIKASLPEESPLVDMLPAFRVEISSARGLFYAKLTGYEAGDYGIVNPRTRFVRVEF